MYHMITRITYPPPGFECKILQTKNVEAISYAIGNGHLGNRPNLLYNTNSILRQAYSASKCATAYN